MSQQEGGEHSRIVSFQVGPNADPDMFEAITGEPPMIVIENMRLQRATLGLQTLDDMPQTPLSEGMPSVRQVLENNWGPDYRALVLIDNPDGEVNVTAYFTTQRAMRYIHEWQLIDLGWMFQVDAVALKPETRPMLPGRAEFIGKKQAVSSVIPLGAPYERFVVDKDVMIAKAESVRQQIDVGR